MNTITGTARSNSVSTSSEDQDSKSRGFITDEFEKNYINTTPDEYYALAKEARDVRYSCSLPELQRVYRKYFQHFDSSAEERLGPLEKTTIFYNVTFLRQEMTRIAVHYDDLGVDKILYDTLTQWELKYKNSSLLIESPGASGSSSID